MNHIEAAFVAFLIVQGPEIEAREYHVNPDADNLVVFYSSAPLENFEGRTKAIDGYVLLSGMDSSGTVGPTLAGEFYFEVNLEDLDTGIGLRNRHMRENYLETDEYPYVSFKGTMANSHLGPGSTYDVECTGTFDLHGIRQERSINVQATSLSDGYHITGEFIVKLEDHNIKVPKLMFLKVDQNIRLSVDFYLKRIKGEN